MNVSAGGGGRFPSAWLFVCAKITMRVALPVRIAKKTHIFLLRWPQSLLLVGCLYVYLCMLVWGSAMILTPSNIWRAMIGQFCGVVMD